MVEEKKKRCCLCGEEKLLEDFYSVKKRNYYDSKCKECNKQKVKEWVEKNPEKRTAIRRKNYLKHKERYNKISSDWNATHKEEHMVSHRKWKEKDPENAKAVRIRYDNKRRAWERDTDSRATTKQINELIKNSNNTCFWCDQEIPNGKMHLDHIYPLSRGGKDEINNLVVSCEYCNKRKANKPPEVWLNEITIAK